FIARVGTEGIFRHQLLGNLPRKDLIDAALDVNFGQFVNFKLDISAQFLALARKVRLFGVGLRADRHILAGGHRHRARHQSRHTRDQYIFLRRGGRGNADDQACRRDDAIVGPENRRSQPSAAADEKALRGQRQGAQPDMARIRSNPAHQKQHDENDDDDADDTDAAMTIAVAVAAEAAAKAAEQEYDEDNDEYEPD